MESTEPCTDKTSSSDSSGSHRWMVCHGGCSWLEICADEESLPGSCFPHPLSPTHFRQGHHDLHAVIEAEKGHRDGNDLLHRTHRLAMVETAKSMDARY